MGALAMGGVASGSFPDLAAATQNLVPVEKVFEPDESFTSCAETRFAQFRALYTATAAISAALVGET
jgi:ribulose kinase